MSSASDCRLRRGLDGASGTYGRTTFLARASQRQGRGRSTHGCTALAWWQPAPSTPFSGRCTFANLASAHDEITSRSFPLPRPFGSRQDSGVWLVVAPYKRMLPWLVSHRVPEIARRLNSQLRSLERIRSSPAGRVSRRTSWQQTKRSWAMPTGETKPEICVQRIDHVHSARGWRACASSMNRIT
jgi:hypothetical protein